MLRTVVPPGATNAHNQGRSPVKKFAIAFLSLALIAGTVATIVAPTPAAACAKAKVVRR
jgi:hypothetical protein